jgi:2-polyprenyl-6-methoxyphenol hydroxylase-like FAD-dependent oxidoreductase
MATRKSLRLDGRMKALKLIAHRLWPIHRADLQQVLLKAALKRGTIVKLDCRVVAVEDGSESVVVLTKSGERIEADLVVGADGKLERNLIPSFFSNSGFC